MDILDRNLTRGGTGLALCWLGNLSWLIQSDGKLVAFDLDIDRDNRLHEPAATTKQIAPVLDFHFITHEHEDHFSTPSSSILRDHSGCLFVVPANCREKALGLGIPESRIAVSTPGEPLEIEGIRVEPLHALHGHAQFSVYRGANFEDCGYLLTFGAWRIFQPGDTVLLQEHLELQDIHILFVSPTIHNMFIDRSLILINALEPRHIFPQHFGTYEETEQNRYWTKGYPDEVNALLAPSMKRRFHKLEQGEVFLLTKD